MSVRPLVVLGAGGHGREALAVARAVNRSRPTWDVLGVVDDGPVDLEVLTRLGAVVLGGTDELVRRGWPHVLAVGDPAVRRRLDELVGDAAPAEVLVDPSAWIGDDVELAPGVIVHPGARCTTNVRIGRHSHLNCAVTVSHDCRIGDHVSLSPGVLLNGAVTVGDGAFVGSGAVVLPGRRVGVGAVVGAGAVVVDDVADGDTVVGVPARPLPASRPAVARAASGA